MAKYLITYDLNKVGQNYEDLINKIKSYKYYSHPMLSVWFIKSDNSAEVIYNSLAPFIDKNDRIFVQEITSNRCGWLSQVDIDFLKS